MTDRLKAGRRFLESGSYALRTRNAVRAREAFQAALTVFAGPDVGMARGHALRGLGELAALEQDARRAAHFFELAITEYRWLCTLLDDMPLADDLRATSKQEAVEAEAITLVLHANLALTRGDVVAAKEKVNTAYPLFRKGSGSPAVASLWDTTARIAAWEGRMSAAIRSWKKALATLGEQGDLRGSCLTALRLAEAELAAGELEASRDHIEEAESLARDFEEPGLSGRVFLAWGSWYARHDQFEAALDAWEDALFAFREAGDVELELATLLRIVRVASRSGRADAPGHLLEALGLVDERHPSALGNLLSAIAEHALEAGKPEVALVAVASARRFWGAREPVRGWAPLLRVAVRALAGLGATRGAVTVAHELAALDAEHQPGLLALRDAWRRRAPQAWIRHIDGLDAEGLHEEAGEAIDSTAGSWCARLSVLEERLGTIMAARTLCDQLDSDAAAVIAVDDRALQDIRPVIVWESADSERLESVLPEGVSTVGRGPDNDVPVPWDEELAEVHCIIHREGSVVRLLDGGSDSGTLVDDERVDEARLNGGERIRIGQTVFRFQLRSAPGAYSRPEAGGRPEAGAVAVAAAPAVVVSPPGK